MTNPTIPSSGLQVGATGVVFSADLVDQDGAPITLAGGATAKFRFWKPTAPGAVVEKAASIVSFSPASISYVVPNGESSFLSVFGDWKVQAYAEDAPTGPFYPGPVQTFRVAPNL